MTKFKIIPLGPKKPLHWIWQTSLHCYMPTRGQSELKPTAYKQIQNIIIINNSFRSSKKKFSKVDYNYRWTSSKERYYNIIRL